MKYNININQVALAETSIDLMGAAILDYLYILCNSKNEKIQKQRIVIDSKWYTWVNYQKLIEDMPLLRINTKSTMSVRVKNLENIGFIRIYTDKKQQKTYICFTEKVDELFVETNGTVRENERNRSSTRTNTITNDSVTKTHIAAPSAAPSKPVKKKTKKVAKPVVPIDFVEEIKKYEDSDQRHINIIASYMEYRKKSLLLKIKNNVQLSVFTKRHCRAAVQLADMAYSDDELVDMFDTVQKKYKDIDWTLETLVKEFTK